NFISVTNVIPGTPATAASGTLSELAAANVTQNSVVTIHTNKYLFATRINNAIPNQVLIASTFDGTMSNLINAINHGPGAGTTYSTASPTNPVVTAEPLTSHSFTVVSKLLGTQGNFIVTTYMAATNNHTVSSNLTWNGHVTLSGGAAATTGSTNVTIVPLVIGGRYGALINNGLM